MRKLPLYPKFPHAAVSTVEPLPQHTNCQRCDLAKTNPSGQRCMSADGTAGDILVVSDYPIEFERNVGRPLVGPSGKFFRKLMDKIAGSRAIVYANAVGCTPPQQYDDFDKSIEACRPYMRDVLDEADPSVVLLVGNHAAQSILGRKYSAYSVRNGYAWIRKPNGENIPAFFLFDPGIAMRNPLVAKALEDDIRWALDNPKLTPPQHSACYELIQTAADAEAAWEALSQSTGFIATDTETSGMMFAPDFRIEMASVSNGERTFVFDRYVFANDPEVMVLLCKILSLLKHTSWNGQYDYCAFQADPLFFPIRDDAYSFDDGLCRRDDYTSVMNLWSDARVKRKLYEADAEASLAVSAELVGMGGHKLENRALVEQICEDLHKYALSFTLTETGKKRTWKGSNFFKASDVPEKWVYYLNEGIAEEKFAHRFVPREVEQRYNALDALSTWHLENWAHDRLCTYEDDGLLTIWNEVCQSTMWAYCRMRTNGMPISSAGVSAFRLLLESEMELSLKSIHRRRPGLNPLSNPQVVELMKDLGIRSKRKTGSGNLSASKEVLEEFKHKHEIIGEILSYRTLQKIHGTYAVGMMPWITPDDCVHPSILQSGTATGRPSAAEPNLLNVVKGRDADTRRVASMFRNCFVAPRGHNIVEADEKQIEIRAAAEFSEDPLMVQTIVSGVDFHKASAEKFAAAMGKDYAAMTDEQKDLLRENSKTTNFAAVYEIPCELPFMLQSRLKIDRREAEKLGQAIFQSYTRLREWMDEMYAYSHATGSARTYWKGKFGRRRPLWGLGFNPPTLAELEKALESSKGYGQAQSGKYDKSDARATYNTPVQGGAVDIVASMLWIVQRWLDENTDGGKLVLHVYDSIMVVVKDVDVPKTVEFLRLLMSDKLKPEQRYTTRVPLGVDIKYGRTWSTLKKYEPTV